MISSSDRMESFSVPAVSLVDDPWSRALVPVLNQYCSSARLTVSTSLVPLLFSNSKEEISMGVRAAPTKGGREAHSCL